MNETIKASLKIEMIDENVPSANWMDSAVVFLFGLLVQVVLYFLFFRSVVVIVTVIHINALLSSPNHNDSIRHFLVKFISFPVSLQKLFSIDVKIKTKQNKKKCYV